MKYNRILKQIFNRLVKYFGILNWWPAESNLEILVGVILTQNTAWSNVKKALNNLKDNNLLDCNKLLTIEKDILSKNIKPAGYFNQKSVYIKNIVKFFFENFDCNFDKAKQLDTILLREKLLSVKGIGKESADSILLYILEKPIFVVDAYTKRIFKRFALIKNNLKYDDVQHFFMSNLQRDVNLFKEFHAQIVYLGKNFCKKKPLCKECPLNDICKKDY